MGGFVLKISGFRREKSHAKPQSRFPGFLAPMLCFKLAKVMCGSFAGKVSRKVAFLVFLLACYVLSTQS